MVLAAVLGGSIVFREVRTDNVAATAQDLAGSLDAVCRADEQAARALGADCDRAAQVARDGVDGVNGSDGRGVLGTTLTATGRLVVSYTDGRSVDVGQVAGANGLDGVDGEAGRGIASTVLTGGRLVVTFTDGATADLGPVVGPTGRGITAADGSTGRLLVTLTDGTVLDAGPLPQGPAGPKGDEGDPAPVVEYQEFRFPDGQVTRCPREGGTDTAPVFACQRSAPPTTPATTGPVPEPGG